MKKQYKKIWRKNFEIKNVAFHLGTPVLADFILYQTKTISKNFCMNLSGSKRIIII